MRKRIIYITLTLSMLLGGYSFYEVKNSTGLLLSENIEALSSPGDSPDEAISIGGGFEYVSMYCRDATGKGPRRIVYDNSSTTWADRRWYKDDQGNKALLCRIEYYPATNYVTGHCFKKK